ncbi:MAG TPA: bifunctional alpha,alpha-trehalose-phosphate synthase (UDP-forming)/trehalose-phosphatase, partial [Candidatus Binatia bacterium]|nr:bifunctional alpha,alpha-trehalose-phosphate synthase (UDP-forming)/trehalose-phosphatase [Candidatus Binatia bacterium]
VRNKTSLDKKYSVMAVTPSRRIVIVSNRLPFTVVQDDEGIQFSESVGGLATGLRTLLTSAQGLPSEQSEYVWVGWPGTTITDEICEQVKSTALSEYNCYPVFLSEQDLENFYQGFCNETIWPLFHYFPNYARYDEACWEQYRKVNESFSATLLDALREEDTVWIHDYHLMLLPHLIRKASPKIRIGFFLHIPFPQFEIFRLMPGKWRREILEGLLGADLIGFHTHDYGEYFLRCVQRILGHGHQMGQIALSDRVVRVGTFPMGIDFEKFHDAANQTEVQKEREEFEGRLLDSKIVLSVDRQDYSKGILHRLQGFEAMLERNPEWRGKVTLIMLVVPSRIGIADYEGMKKRIEELVGKINGRFGTISWVPIIYQYRSLPFQSLVAMYAMSHVALVTPLRDGMNLVAKEYIATRHDQTGVLVLSEMAGASKELPEAIIINPNNREEIADALKTALEMPCEEQIRRNEIMQNRLRRYDVTRWARDFLVQLLSVCPVDEQSQVKSVAAPFSRALTEYHHSARRLLILDYDGTLVPFALSPELAKPTARLLRLLRSLASDPHNELLLATGRDRGSLDRWFKGIPMGLAAEHGAWIKEWDGDWKRQYFVDPHWKQEILPILKTYADRVPGAFVEEKEFSLVWHYRMADQEQGRPVARELTDHLLVFTASIDLQVLRGNRAIEIRKAGINKGGAVQQWIDKANFDFILAIGDDATDEDMFAVLPHWGFSFRVGTHPTRAQFRLSGPAEVLQLLGELAANAGDCDNEGEKAKAAKPNPDIQRI